MAARNRLIRFYLGTSPDDRGRFLKEIQNWSDDELERTHDYIQWLFPLVEHSGFNPGAPVLDESTIHEFHVRAELRANLRTSFLRMLTFYGFELGEDPVRIVPSKSFAERATNWLSRSNHNQLRITRILKSTNMLGLKKESSTLQNCLEALYRIEANKREPGISKETFKYWESARRCF